MADQPTPTPSYRWAAFTHWANLAVLAGGGIAGATIDPSIWYALLPAEALVLWLASDLPPLRRAVDARFERRRRDAERAYYLEQLWGLAPAPRKSFGDRLKELFVSDPAHDVDERLSRRADCGDYIEMREIVTQLRDMIPHANGRVTERDIERLERVVNGYLRVLFACGPLAHAVEECDEKALSHQFADVEARLTNADAALRPVLLERKRLLEMQLQRLPRLRATLELLRARTQAIPQQLRNLLSQVLTDPGTEVQGALDDMIERNDMLADPLADLSNDEAVRTLLAQAPANVPPRRSQGRRVATGR
jgi:hypothetical protein